MKSIAILSVLTTVALAQSSASSTAAATPSANPLIPTGVSSGCESFLTSLDSDTSLSSCTTPLITATSQFGPSANSASTPSSAAISSVLDNICGSASSCSEQTLRSKLTDFYSACTAELTSNANSDVINIYDVFYALTPLKNAVCTKNLNDKYCVTEITAPSSNAGASGTNVDIAVGSNFVSSIKHYLWSQVSKTKRATAQTPAMIPNTTTYRNNNVLFFLLQPNMDSTILCTVCTRSVLMSYFNFEQSVPYGPGISSSPLMGGQMDLYNAVNNVCGSDFFSGGVQAAGGLSGGLVGTTSAAVRSVSQSFGGVVTAVMGTVAFGFAAIL
ncbi:hypothetical protein PILCRDRAFT_812760 [Piloderma croceum F 1598]|uniref:Uncharacterized protein n=1 Tax=Piloderma croceum (strain F 1598) TaxID=765440 RepID=A0A0C3GE53_PILCF|nr:hypothetical protein PILCRDRAFT_812760 [Piloderma croceum F 1598]